MFTITKVRAAIVAFAGVLAVALPATALAQNPLQWTTGYWTSGLQQPNDVNTYVLGNVNRPVFYNPNTTGGPDAWQDLVNKHQFWGIDLDWYTPSSQETYSPSGGPALQWKFVRQGRHTLAYWQRPLAWHLIPGTERVALYNVARHQYLAYADQVCYPFIGCKPPLVYSTTPRFEWQVANGLLNADTYSVRAVELYNTTAGGYLINSHEDLGVDLDFQSGPFHLPNAYNPPPPPYPVAVSTFSR